MFLPHKDSSFLGNSTECSTLCPQNLLVGFWVCFKLLLKWLYEGVSPNLFIPQNNMFLSKVHGSAQKNLFLQMHRLYDQGLVCKLQSPSIRSYVTDVLYNPRLFICTDENRMKSEGDNDKNFLKKSVNIKMDTDSEETYITVYSPYISRDI